MFSSFRFDDISSGAPEYRNLGGIWESFSQWLYLY